MDGVLLYRHRTGYLRSAVLEAIEEISDRSQRLIGQYSAGELKQSWEGDSLFPITRVCELVGAGAAREFKDFKARFDQTPAEPTVILVKAAKWNRGTFPNVTRVDEPEISKGNISEALQYLAAVSKFAVAQHLLGQRAFQRYFSDWIKEEKAAPLPDLAKEFDRSILLHTRPGSSEFSPPSPTALDITVRTSLCRALRQYLDCPTPNSRRAVVRTVAARCGIGLSYRALIEQLIRASLTTVTEACRSRVKPGRGVKVSAEAALLWAALVTIYTRRVDKTTVKFLPISLMVGHLLFDFEKRLNALCSDPLEGLWNELSVLCCLP